MNNTNTLQSTSDSGTATLSTETTNRQIYPNRSLILNHELPLPRPLTSSTTSSMNQPTISISAGTNNSGFNSNFSNTNSGNSNSTSISLPPINQIHQKSRQQLPVISPNYSTSAAAPPPPPQQLLPQPSPLPNQIPGSQQQGQPTSAYIIAPFGQSIQIQQQQYLQPQHAFIPQVYQYQQLQNYTHQPLTSQAYTLAPHVQMQMHQHQHLPQSQSQQQQQQQQPQSQPQHPQSAEHSQSQLPAVKSPLVKEKLHESHLKPLAKMTKGTSVDKGKIEKPKVKSKSNSPKFKRERIEQSNSKLLTLVDKLQGLITPNERFNKFLNFVNGNAHLLLELSKRLKGNGKLDFSDDANLKDLYNLIANFPRQELESLESINNKYIDLFSFWKTVESTPLFSPQPHDYRNSSNSLLNEDVLDESLNYPKVPGESVSLKVVPLKPAENQNSLEFNSQGTLQPDLSITMKLACQHCGSTSTPEWRKGPDDAKILCNACGLFHTKLVKKLNPELARLELRKRRENGESTNRRI